MTRILVVDDDTFVRMMLSLEVPEVELLEASTVEEGFAVANAERPDAVIVDRKLLDGSGVELVRRLRNNFGTSRTPIVVATAGYDPAHLERMVQAGADDYVAKPFNPRQLFLQIERLLALPAQKRRPRRTAALDALRHGKTPNLQLDPSPREIDLAKLEAEAQRSWWRRRKPVMQ